MYLPEKIDQGRLLILVKTYPMPASTYGETVCTAGLLEGDKWVRVHPIAWQMLEDDQKYSKYSWIQLDLVREESDFRQESYRPHLGFDEPIKVVGHIDTADQWIARKEYVFREVFTSMHELLTLAKGKSPKSLATFKPAEVVEFIIEPETDPDWKPKWLVRAKQTNMFDLGEEGVARRREFMKKVPYRFKYRFLVTGEKRPREMTILDWEIGALFWNCLRRANGDEEVAKQQVKHKYFDEIASQRDVHLFLGTNYRFHRKRSPNPFMIVGVFYPPRGGQLPLFSAYREAS